MNTGAADAEETPEQQEEDVELHERGGKKGGDRTSHPALRSSELLPTPSKQDVQRLQQD